jgi:hypothetical protein
MEAVSIETVTMDGNWLFRRFRPCFTFQIIQNYVWLHISYE